MCDSGFLDVTLAEADELLRQLGIPFQAGRGQGRAHVHERSAAREPAVEVPAGDFPPGRQKSREGRMDNLQPPSFPLLTNFFKSRLAGSKYLR